MFRFHSFNLGWSMISWRALLIFAEFQVAWLFDQESMNLWILKLFVKSVTLFCTKKKFPRSPFSPFFLGRSEPWRLCCQTDLFAIWRQQSFPGISPVAIKKLQRQKPSNILRDYTHAYVYIYIYMYLYMYNKYLYVTCLQACLFVYFCYFWKWVFPKIVGKPPKWMVKIMENPMYKWVFWGENPPF